MTALSNFFLTYACTDMGPVIPGRPLNACPPFSEKAMRQARYEQSVRRGARKKYFLDPPPPPAAAEAPLPDDVGKKLFDLGDNDCRFPLGIDCDGALRFCGCPIHRPRLRNTPMYCGPHGRVATRVITEEEHQQFVAEALAAA